MSIYQKRYLDQYLIKNKSFLEKMVFIPGPRQVGKTTLLFSLAKQLGYSPKEIHLFNWDRKKDSKQIRSFDLTFFEELIANKKNKKPVVLFDEIHKFSKWKTYLKGYFDTVTNNIITLVTGSARLDIYRRGGDSLLGRYWLYHLNPFSLSEALHQYSILPFTQLKNSSHSYLYQTYQTLYHFGGFPEPFLKKNPSHHNQWHRLKKERLLREDLRDLSNIKELEDIEILMGLIKNCVGSTLSLNSLREQLEVSYNAVKNWVKWLESLYYCFKLPPYTKKVTRALKKDKKYYLYDWSELKDESARFENMVAVHLKKSVDYWNDTGVGNFELFYVRNQQKEEVDFLVVYNENPWLLVEAKFKKEQIPKSLIVMSQSIKPTHSVLVTHGEEEGSYQVINHQKYWVTGACHFLSNFV